MLSQLDVLRRVVLTGTPLQNELKELYAIVNLVCPDILGSESKFLRNYEEPIVRSKQPDAHPEEVEFGNEKMQELNRYGHTTKSHFLVTRFAFRQSDSKKLYTWKNGCLRDAGSNGRELNSMRGFYWWP